MIPALLPARRTLILALATATALALGAGLAAAAPVSGFVVGQVVSVKGSSFVVKDSFGSVGDSTVTLGGKSSIVEQVSATTSDLKDGACVVANGQRASSGAVDAMRLTISTPVKGSCSTGFGGRGRGPRPGGGTRPTGAGNGPPANFAGFANFGFASGSIISLKGSTLTVKGASGTATIELSSSTQLLAMRSVDASAIRANECARVAGTSSNDGLTVAATSVSLSQPSSTSGCGGGFPGRP